MKISSIFKQINLFERYRELCLSYSKAVYGNTRPPKDLVLDTFKKFDWHVKYVAKDKIYILKYQLGDYSLEYYFELNGSSLGVAIYIKRGNEWPMHHDLGYLLNLSNLYPNDPDDDLIGKVIYCSTLLDLEDIIKKIKPLLEDFKNVTEPYLKIDNIEFDISA